MSRDISSKIYADFTYSRIPTAIRSSFSEEQATAVRNALVAHEIASHHGVDIRVSVPLFFRRYYFVILGGRDRRARTLALELARLRRLPRGVVRIVYLTVTASLIGSAILGSLALVYLVKSWVGIDLFADFHLKDLLPIDLFGFSKELLGGKK